MAFVYALVALLFIAGLVGSVLPALPGGVLILAGAVAGAVVGALVGLFFGLPGLLLGPLVGSLGAEYVYTRQLDSSARAAFGTVIGLLVGAVAKVGLALAMVALFSFWVWRG